MIKTIEQQVADTILQTPKEIKIGNETHTVSPPSTATLILVSEAVSLLPKIEVNEDDIVRESLSMAKDCRVLGDIVAILVLGAKNINDRVIIKHKQKNSYLWGLIKVSWTTETEEKKKDLLARQILEEYSPSELQSLITTLLQGLELGDFFALTTFLIDVNLIRPTKVEIKN